jgi:hypothetical protein
MKKPSPRRAKAPKLFHGIFIIRIAGSELRFHGLLIIRIAGSELLFAAGAPRLVIVLYEVGRNMSINPQNKRRSRTLPQRA